MELLNCLYKLHKCLRGGQFALCPQPHTLTHSGDDRRTRLGQRWGQILPAAVGLTPRLSGVSSGCRSSVAMWVTSQKAGEGLFSLPVDSNLDAIQAPWSGRGSHTKFTCRGEVYGREVFLILSVLCVSLYIFKLIMPRILAKDNCNINNIKLCCLTFISLLNIFLPFILKVLGLVPLTDKYCTSSCDSQLLHAVDAFISMRVLHIIKWKWEPYGT